jgi:hypothetical protein
MATNALRPIAFLPQMPMKPTAAAHQSSSLPANMQETARMNSAAPSCLNSHPTHVAVNNQRAQMFATPISGTRLPFGSMNSMLKNWLGNFLRNQLKGAFMNYYFLQHHPSIYQQQTHFLHSDESVNL